MNGLNETHDAALSSWVTSANQDGCDFPLQNLPLAEFRRTGSGEAFRGGVALGDQLIDLGLLAAEAGQLVDAHVLETLQWAAQPQLNALMAQGSESASALRLALSRAYRGTAPSDPLFQRALVPLAAVEFAVPAGIGDYTDFYTSIHHATAVGRLFRPDQPLLPNYKWLPVGYHGRSSTIMISGTPVRRPMGQVLPVGASAPVFCPSQRLDYELELGFFVGAGNADGRPLSLDEAERSLFGVCLLNDWSARDLQAWEYQPLGPFLAKSFATSVSPWIVTMEALAPFRLPFTRPPRDPQPLPHLDSPANREHGALDIRLEVALQTARQRDAGHVGQVLAGTSYRHAYWTAAQMLAHHASNGCLMRPGDLLGTGTQSGPEAAEAGSLLELTRGGRQALQIGDETRDFLADGDIVRFRGWCQRAGFRRIGLGQVQAEVLPANA